MKRAHVAFATLLAFLGLLAWAWAASRLRPFASVVFWDLRKVAIRESRVVEIPKRFQRRSVSHYAVHVRLAEETEVRSPYPLHVSMSRDNAEKFIARRLQGETWAFLSPDRGHAHQPVWSFLWALQAAVERFLLGLVAIGASLWVLLHAYGRPKREALERLAEDLRLSHHAIGGVTLLLLVGSLLLKSPALVAATLLHALTSIFAGPSFRDRSRRLAIGFWIASTCCLLLYAAVLLERCLEFLER